MYPAGVMAEATATLPPARTPPLNVSPPVMVKVPSAAIEYASVCRGTAPTVPSRFCVAVQVRTPAPLKLAVFVSEKWLAATPGAELPMTPEFVVFIPVKAAR